MALNFSKVTKVRLCTFITSNVISKSPRTWWKTPPPSYIGLRPPIQCILQILTTFNLYSGIPGVGLSVKNKQKVRQAMVKISRGGCHTLPPAPPPPLGRICQPKLLDNRRVNRNQALQGKCHDTKQCDPKV